MWSKYKKLNNKEKMEYIFNTLSIIIILIFCFYYLTRMLYYKEKFVVKDEKGNTLELLVNKVKQNIETKEDGLYEEGLTYIYKGEKVNNYLLFNNLLFRIVKINVDQTIEIITDSPYNYLAYDKNNVSFSESNINHYLNNYFIKNIDTKYLIKSTICIDEINDVNKITCQNKTRNNYIKLLSINDYINSKNNQKSYITSDQILLYNNSKNGIWSINNSNLSINNSNDIYQINPVLTLNNTTTVLKGTGTKKDPYIINESDFGKYVKIDNDMYQIYQIDEDKYRLVADNLYNNETKYSFSYLKEKFNITNKGLGQFLNTEVYSNLTYKDYLLECDYYIGNYNSDYLEVLNEKITTKIGTLSIIDPIFNQNLNDYYLLNKPNEEENYTYKNNKISKEKSFYQKSIRMTICISKDKIKSGDGTKESPLVVK